MASKRRLRRKQLRRSCQDKQDYPTEAAAMHRVWLLLRRNRKNAATARCGFLHAYKCQFCEHWHIGNSKDSSSIDKFIEKLKQGGLIPTS